MRRARHRAWTGIGVGASAAVVLLALPTAAAAAVPPDPLGIPCQAQGDGVRYCLGSTVPSVASPSPHAVVLSSQDGSSVAIDVNVVLPPASTGGGGYPLVMIFHGYAGTKKPPDAREAEWLPSAHELARKGYAVLNASDRGFGDSCGSVTSRLVNAGDCARGWVRLMDARFEVNDAQQMAGRLADQGWIDPQRVGAIGESYGGGEALMLATLKDRVMTLDGRLAPWQSPGRHLPLRIAAAAPTIPWSDLITALTPNGHGLTYTVAHPGDASEPPGVLKQSFVTGLYALGQLSGLYAPPLLDPGADLTSWFATLTALEPDPSDPVFRALIGELRAHHGALYVLDGAAAGGASGEPPAPMLLSSGFTDDLFPVD